MTKRRKVSTQFKRVAVRKARVSWAQVAKAPLKKIENRKDAIVRHFIHYNFGPIDTTLRMTPAMTAGVASRAWSRIEISALAPAPEAKHRGPYKNRNDTR